ncbi:Biopolymer transport protein ExbD [compost metagenome]
MAFGRFSKPASHPPISAINVTPLVDVMLVLLVIFIMAAPLLAASIRLDLPKAASATADNPPAAIAVQMNAKGELFVDGKATDLAALKALLKQQAERNPQTEVQLSIDQSLPYARAVELMDAAQSAGLTRMGFVAQPAAASSAAQSR